MDTEVDPSVASSYESYLEIREDAAANMPNSATHSECGEELTITAYSTGEESSRPLLTREGGSSSYIPEMVSVVTQPNDLISPGMGGDASFLASPGLKGSMQPSDLDVGPLIGSFETRQRSQSEASEKVAYSGWKWVLLNRINRLMDRLMLNQHYQPPSPNNVTQVLNLLIQDTYSFRRNVGNFDSADSTTNTEDPTNLSTSKAVTLKEPKPISRSNSSISVKNHYHNKEEEAASSRASRFGKLGELIGTQVFVFEQWDQFETIQPVQLGEYLEELSQLRQEVYSAKDMKELDMVRLLNPFLRVLESGVSSGSIMSSSLSALQEFLALGLIRPNLKSFSPAINKLAEALVKCRFLSGDPEVDELALLDIIRTIRSVTSHTDFLIHMTSHQVENLLRSALAVSCQTQISKSMRGQAERILVQIVSQLFQSFRTSQEELLYRILESFISLLEPHKKHSVITQLLGIELIRGLMIDMGNELFERNDSFRELLSGKLCQYLWMLLDVEDIDTVTRSLELIRILLFQSQNHLKQQQLLWIQKAMSRLTELSHLPPSSGSYILHFKERLSFLFTDFLLGLVNSHPSFLNEVYVNYDCALNQPDLAGDILEFLVENSLRHTKSQDGNTYRPNLFMDQILVFLVGLFDRRQCEVGDSPLAQLTHLKSLVEKYTRTFDIKRNQYCTRTIADLRDSQRNKKNIREGVSLFNKKPWDGINFLIHCQLLPARDTSDFNNRLSHFLHTTPGIDKKILGDFLSKLDHVPILEAFIEEFNFANKRLDIAMREFLTSFRLPGESQLISRIFELFSDKYFATAPEHLHDSDSVYLLAYSILMVNTDLHSHQVKRKIQFPSFKNMHTGSNGGKGVDEKFLRSIYDAIAEDEIVLPEEQKGVVSREYTWNLYTKGPAFDGTYSYCRSGQYDREVLLSAHSLLCDLFIQTFVDASNDLALQVALQGLHLLLQVSHHHGLCDVVDYTLRRIRGLANSIFGPPEDGASLSNRNRTQQVDGAILSDLSQALGHSYKVQLVTVFLMGAAGQFSSSLFEAWWDILNIMRLFADSCLLPTSLAEVPQLTLPVPSPSSLTAIPFRPPAYRPASRRRSSDARDDHEVVTLESGSGILATFSSFLGYSSQYPTLIWDVSPQILFSCLDSVRKLIPACQIDQVMGGLGRLDSSSFEVVLKRIMILVKNQHGLADELPVAPSSPTKPTATYLPSTAFFIHWIVQATTSRPDSDQHWPLVVSFLSDVCYHAEYYHPYLVQLSVTELMLILFSFLHHGQQEQTLSPRCTLILNRLAILSPIVVEMTCVPLLAGFKLLHEANPSIFSQMPYWTICLHMLQAAFKQEHATTAQEIFPLAQRLAETVHFIQLGHVDYLALVNLLNEFCNPDRFIQSSRDAVDPIVARSLLAIEYLAGLLPKVPLLASGNASPECAQPPTSLGSSPNARSFYYLPPLIGLSSLFLHERKDIRQQAYQLLKRNITSRGLLSSSKDPAPIDWVPIFTRVLFPLLEKILDPTLEMQDARISSISLSSSTFLHFVTSSFGTSPYLEDHYATFSDLWLQYLDLLLQMVHIPGLKGVSLEAAHETLRNATLVLISTHLLSLPNTSSTQKSIEFTSNCTWDKINAKFPSIMAQLFPPSPKMVVNEVKDPSTPPLSSTEKMVGGELDPPSYSQVLEQSQADLPPEAQSQIEPKSKVPAMLQSGEQPQVQSSEESNPSPQPSSIVPASSLPQKEISDDEPETPSPSVVNEIELPPATPTITSTTEVTSTDLSYGNI